jgi:small subunit ribosomal protein S1
LSRAKSLKTLRKLRVFDTLRWLIMGTEFSAKNGSTLAQILKSELSGKGRLQENDVLEVEVLKITPREVYFDLGKFGTGIVYGNELQNAKEILKTLAPGEKVPARIERLDGFMGYTELSLSEAGKQKLWKEVKDLEEKGEIVKVKINGANQGGLTCDLAGLKAFLPISQLSQEHLPKSLDTDRVKMGEELKGFVGQEFSVKIITVNPRNNKLIVSERETVSPSQNIKELLSKYSVGQVVDGIVSGVADFGVFVRFTDNPDIEGLVHISEIDYRLIDNPKEAVKLNEPVQVKILDIRDGRVYLSLKALKPDPWEKIEERYKAEQEVSGKIYKFTGFGAIVDVMEDGLPAQAGIQGMVHVSEFGGTEEMRAALKLGETYSFTISSLKPEEKRLILKLKK